jgi:hypothetical protein
MYLYQHGQHRAALAQHHPSHHVARHRGLRAGASVLIMAAVILAAAGAALAVLMVIWRVPLP